jgi:hypothetical protein
MLLLVCALLGLQTVSAYKWAWYSGTNSAKDIGMISQRDGVAVSVAKNGDVYAFGGRDPRGSKLFLVSIGSFPLQFTSSCAHLFSMLE